MDLNILFKDAESNVIKQKNDIRELVKNGIDVLIVSPVTSFLTCASLCGLFQTTQCAMTLAMDC